MDGKMESRTDAPSYRNAMPHLKPIEHVPQGYDRCVLVQGHFEPYLHIVVQVFFKFDQQTDG